MKPTTTTKRNSRTKGRPDSAEGVGRDALLEAAVQELRSATPESLTLAGVAARAGVHPALIRYYFGNKDGLLRDVAQLLVERGQEIARPKIESNASLDEKLNDRLRSMIELVQANPHFHHLILDQVYSQADPASQDNLLGRITARGMRLTIAMLHDDSGARVRRIDPRFLHVAIIGLTEFFLTAKPLLLELFGEDADMEELKVRYIDFLNDLILHGITESTEQIAPPMQA